MNEHLDSDFNKWPEDPFKLLNVDKGADKKTVRRAYNRLIKIYKPDHNPEEFRLIRSAYEAIKNNNIFQSYSSLSQLISDVELKITKEEKSKLDLVDIHWEKALQDEYDFAAKGLYEIARETYDPEAVLKLYWLLKVDPAISKINIFSLLLNSYLANRNYRVSTVIFRMLDQKKDWVLSSECLTYLQKLLEEKNDDIRQFLEKRWQNAYLENRLEIISEDIEILRSLFLHNSEEWGLVLILGHNFLSFSEHAYSNDHLIKYHKELDGLPLNLGGYLDNAMDSYDFLREIRRIVRNDKEENISSVWREIIADFWAGNPEFYKDKIEGELLKWLNNPEEVLTLFEGVSVKLRSILISQVKRIIQNYVFTYSQVFEPDYKAEERRIRQFLKMSSQRGYFSERKSILYFCLYQDVAPDAIVHYVMTNEIEHFYWIKPLVKDIHTSIYLAQKAILGS